MSRRGIFPWTADPENALKKKAVPSLQVRKILVPIKGESVDIEALRWAGEMAKRDKGTVYAVHILEVDRSLPLNAPINSDLEQGQSVCELIEEIAHMSKYPVETEILQAREAGPAIVDEACEREVDLIVVGMSYKQKFGEFSMGEVAPYVLKNAPCMVWLYREKMPPREMAT